MANGTLPTPEELRNLLTYEPETGVLTWKSRSVESFGPDRAEYRCKCWNTRYAGRVAFTTVSGGYFQGRCRGQLLLAHRVVWALATGNWPNGQIDHVNGDKSDNRLANLRDVDQADNQRNMKRCSRNTSGHTGVYLTRAKKWNAQIYSGRKSTSLGTFETFGEAVKARIAAEIAFGFHPNHGKR